ncbi:MAG: thiamine pyrophosphate-dependent dehydrogenase E1 component subunit alpha [Gemmatimonadaceae bacterium]|nr:thiamine pyrophosphate-dependent dehydrogenase E1 component subunit alpha [Gemmatimonadaceae bacterium]
MISSQPAQFRNSEVAIGLDLFRTMIRIRAFEEAASEAHRAGDIPGTLHLSIGQEAVPTGTCSVLRRDDFVSSTHRGHGHCLAKGAQARAMMAELFGRNDGCCGGKGGSMHIADFGQGMLGANGVVAAGIGIAVGAAQACQLRKTDRIAVAFFGDGAVNRGPFMEALNWAALFRLPIVFVCEDNGYAAFTRSSETTAGEGAAARAKACGVTSLQIDGNDALAVRKAAEEAVATARRGSGPTLIHAVTYRLFGHTIADRAMYRPASELAEHQSRDPIERHSQVLTALGVTGEQLDDITNNARSEMSDAVAFARGSAWPAGAALFADVQDLGAPVWP